jgi:hypothetical protein
VFETELGGPYDVIVANYIYHHFDRKTVRRCPAVSLLRWPRAGAWL